MRKVFTLLFLFIVVNTSYAQRHEIGLFIGGSNTIGDYGADYYVAPNSFAIGGLFKWNVSTRLAIRADVGYSLMRTDETKSRYPYSASIVNRDTIWKKNIFNAELLLEWNLFEYNLSKKHAQTPYIFVGVGALSFENIERPISKLKSTRSSINSFPELEGFSKYTLSIPFGLGYKYAISHDFVLAADLKFRYTFSDNLDNSNPEGDDGDGFSRVGNLESNDWLTTVGITLTYSFGRPPCSCGQ